MHTTYRVLSPKVVYWFLTAILLPWGLSSVANAQSVGSACPPIDENTHKELLTYAVLAEAAYAQESIWTPALPDICASNIDIESEIAAPINTWPISDRIVISAENAVAEAAVECDGKQRPVLESYVFPDTNETFFSCSHDTTVNERLAMAVRYGSERNSLFLLIKVAIVGFTALTDTEELEIMELSRNGSERVLGVQGTDITRIIPQLSTSIYGLMENSCLFDLAVEISQRFFLPNRVKEFEADRNAIVGHSLGGAVAQYVGSRIDLQKRIRIFRSDAVFRAYSFNSIGVRGLSSRESYHAHTHSVKISGEVLEDFQHGFDTSQVGHLYRYEPLKSRYPWPPAEKINRHSIARVQAEICRCIGGE